MTLLAPLTADGFPGRLEVHSIALETEGTPGREVTQHLLPDEEKKMRRYRFAADQARYGQTKASLRMLLGHKLGLPPLQVPIQHDRRGKPFLGLETNQAHRIQFNTSHSGNLALIALAETRESITVGVDVERHHPGTDWESMHDMVLTDEEHHCVATAERSLDIFYVHWVTKEASLKAIGCGITEHLKHIAVELDRQRSRVLKVHSSVPGYPTVSAQTLEVAPGYSAAIAWCALDEGSP